MEREDQEMAGAKLRRPALPWSVRLRISVVMAATGLAQRHNGTVNRSLVSLVDRQTPARPRPDTHGVRSADVTVDASRGLWARVFSPVSAGSPLAVIVYIHGGGFTMFTAATISYDAMCRRFCRELGAVVVSVNYRLAPEHRFPAAYEDGLDVLRHLSATGLPDFAAPVDLSRCFLVGDSAGGNIAHHVAQRWTSSPPPPNPIRLAGVVLLQPFFGGEKRTVAELRLEGVGPIVNMRRSDWWWRAFLPDGADRNHPASHVTGDAGPEPDLPEEFPPAMVVIGGYDSLQDWQRRYVGMLQRKGKAVLVVDYPEAIHGFCVFPELADSGKLVMEMKAFMQTNTRAQDDCLEAI